MPIAFHSGSFYDQRLAEEFKKRFTSFGENAEKCINSDSSNRKRSYKN